MNQKTAPNHTPAPIACATDKSCRTDNQCGCKPTTNPEGQRRNAKAAVLGLMCLVGCLAGPIAIGGAAALGGTLTGETWLLIDGSIVAAVVAFTLKRRSSRSIC